MSCGFLLLDLILLRFIRPGCRTSYFLVLISYVVVIFSSQQSSLALNVIEL
jgi:hypothetical protein